MRLSSALRSVAPVAAVLTALLMTSACGDVEVTSDSKKSDSSQDKSAAPDPSAAVDTSVANGNWLLGMQSAGGEDAETATTVYITYNPSTGQATAHKMPGVKAGSADSQQAALLVSTDRHWAIPDTEISHGEENSGQLKVYSLTNGAHQGHRHPRPQR